jgi:hypothetical protein
MHHKISYFTPSTMAKCLCHTNANKTEEMVPDSDSDKQFTSDGYDLEPTQFVT